MTVDITRPDWQVALIERGRKRLDELSTGIIERIDSDRTPTVDDIAAMSDDEALADLCSLLAHDLYAEKYDWQNGKTRCGWCVHAAGDTQAAADASPTMTLAEVREHAKTCGHSPMVVEVAKLRADIIELRQALDAAEGPHCSSCGNAIDPDTCWCGDGQHDAYDGHAFVPMGCDCLRVDREWQVVASALRGYLASVKRKLASATTVVDELRKLRAANDPSLDGSLPMDLHAAFAALAAYDATTKETP